MHHYSCFSCENKQLTHTLIEWSGINALLYYGPTLVAALGIGSSGAAGGGEGEGAGLIVSGGIGIVQLLAVGPAIVWIDSLGEFDLFFLSFCSAFVAVFRAPFAFRRLFLR